MDRFEHERIQMVQTQIAKRDLTNPRLLAAFEAVPRHLFVPNEYSHAAYSDGPLPIGFSQTISQPYIVALMTDLLNLEGSERVLEVGTGSGYQAAILSKMTREVHTIEYVPELAAQAEMVLKDLGMDNVHVHVGDGSLGLPEFAPYAGILVAAAAPKVPENLLNQLEEGGRLVLPVGGRGMQYLELWERNGKKFLTKTVTAVAFVPLRGEKGWDRKE